MDKIQAMLQELYKIDPKLQSEEGKLKSIIEKMIEIRPNTRFDEKFRLELRNKIIEEIHNTRRKKEQKKILFDIGYFVSGLALASFVFMIVGPNIFKTVEKPKQEISYDSKISSGKTMPKSDSLSLENTTGSSINSTGSQTLGLSNTGISASNTGIDISKTTIIKEIKNISGEKNNLNQSLLTFNITTKKEKDDAFGTIKGDSYGASSGIGGGSNTASFKSQGTPTTLDGTQEKTSVPNTSNGQKFVYKGEKIEIKESKMEALKKEKKSYTNADLNNLIKSIKLDVFDISKLEKLFVNNITVSEDKDYGLQMNINLDEANISLYKNRKKWPQNNCNTDECYSQNKIKMDQIPTQEKAINIANEFVTSHGINISNYANPYLDTTRLKTYNEASYLPESISVIYPLKIEGKAVYEESGYSKGLTITIDIKSQKVQEVYGLEKLNFLSSMYETETNFDKILEIATKGGRNNPTVYKTGENSEISLGTPVLEYTYIYDYKDGVTEEYIVPAYIFPILDNQNYGPSNIVVPILQDLYK
ncbi:MAG: hypothetical protein PHF46_01365 [Candidatus Gracilibacteria bacterium]|nr:hypothetical protein [Candidatus Gracilibacteria bacterium]MDD3120040.1 hypothetical protein [Candidatus Gracilibacteria bacterium]MDD4530388.1 hypothetical protein [Candidatus Gracilibacteria bacterium]